MMSRASTGTSGSTRLGCRPSSPSSMRVWPSSVRSWPTAGPVGNRTQVTTTYGLFLSVVADPDSFNSDPVPDPDPGLWWPKIGKNNSNFFSFLIKNCKFALSGIIDVRLGGKSNPEERMFGCLMLSLFHSLKIQPFHCGPLIHRKYKNPDLQDMHIHFFSRTRSDRILLALLNSRLIPGSQHCGNKPLRDLWKMLIHW